MCSHLPLYCYQLYASPLELVINTINDNGHWWLLVQKTWIKTILPGLCEGDQDKARLQRFPCSRHMTTSASFLAATKVARQSPRWTRRWGRTHMCALTLGLDRDINRIYVISYICNFIYYLFAGYVLHISSTYYITLQGSKLQFCLHLLNEWIFMRGRNA